MPRFNGMRLAILFPPPADNTPPRFLTASSGSVSDNAQLSFSITTDEQCTVAITGGADLSQFELATTSLGFSHILRWTSNGVRRFVSPADSDANNTYIVQVTGTDQSGNNQSSQTITITVTEVFAGEVMGLLAGITKAA